MLPIIMQNATLPSSIIILIGSRSSSKAQLLFTMYFHNLFAGFTCIKDLSCWWCLHSTLDISDKFLSLSPGKELNFPVRPVHSKSIKAILIGVSLSPIMFVIGGKIPDNNYCQIASQPVNLLQ